VWEANRQDGREANRQDGREANRQGGYGGAYSSGRVYGWVSVRECVRDANRQDAREANLCGVRDGVILDCCLGSGSCQRYLWGFPGF
jgi:hypothetical protein